MAVPSCSWWIVKRTKSANIPVAAILGTRSISIYHRFYDARLIVAESISPFHRFTVSVKISLQHFYQRGCVVIKVYGAASYFLATEGGIFLRRLISEVFPKIFDSQAVKSAI